MTAASASYEIVVHATDDAASWIRRLWSFVLRREAGTGAAIISVVHCETGTEVFRHIEEIDDDDDDHLLPTLRRDLASMSAEEFAARWSS